MEDEESQDGGSDQPNESGKGNDENALSQNFTRLTIPSRPREIFKQYAHISEWLPALNARYFFLQGKKERETKKAALERRETKKRRILKEKKRQNELYPCDSFIVAGTASNGGADVKGSVLLPGSNESLDVEGYVLHMEFEQTHTLLVMRSLSQECTEYLTALCPVELLPTKVTALLKKEARRKKKTWTEVNEFDTHQVKRGSQDLHLVTSGPFSHRTCDDSMLESIRSGFVVAVRGVGSSRLKYGACRVPFVRGSELQSSKAFIVSLESGIMHLSYLCRAASNVAQRILACAVSARNMLIEENGGNSTLTGALSLMERFSHRARESETERLRCLNVALGGPPAFKEYGRFVPCRELCRRNSFPNGSFASTPCSCDIITTEEDPTHVRDIVRNRKAKNGNKKGHNSITKKQSLVVRIVLIIL